MKISEFISELSKVIETHGDLEVLSWSGKEPFAFTPVAVATRKAPGNNLPASPYLHMRGEQVPNRLYLTSTEGKKKILRDK